MLYLSGVHQYDYYQYDYYSQQCYTSMTSQPCYTCMGYTSMTSQPCSYLGGVWSGGCSSPQSLRHVPAAVSSPSTVCTQGHRNIHTWVKHKHMLHITHTHMSQTQTHVTYNTVKNQQHINSQRNTHTDTQSKHTHTYIILWSNVYTHTNGHLVTDLGLSVCLPYNPFLSSLHYKYNALLF